MSKITQGFLWSSIERFSIQGASFLLSILIARMVSPSAYGLIVMIQVFISFSQLFIDSGFANALIQKKDRTDADFSTAFIFNLIVSVILYAILFAAAPLIADFYNEPRLTLITRVISLNLIISSLSIVQRCRLTIMLDFRTQAKVGLTAVIISGGVGLFCAYSGMEVWALVIQSILCQLLTSILLNVYSHWIPKLVFSYSSFKQLFSFGSRLLVGSVITNIYLNLYNLIIGKFYSPADLGFYNRGYTLAQYLPANIYSILSRIVYPIECELQDDREKLIRIHYKYMRLTYYIISPTMILLAVLAKPLISVVLTEKWIPAAPLLSIISLTYLISPLSQYTLQMLNVIGRSKLFLKSILTNRFFSFIILIITLPFGIEALTWGIFASTAIEYFIALYAFSRAMKVSIRNQLGAVTDILLPSLLTGGITLLLYLLLDGDYIQLLVGGLTGLSTYIAMTFLLKLEERYFYAKALSYLKKYKRV